MGQLKSLKSTYIKIALLFAAWGSMVLLRAMIVIQDEPVPIVYEYHRPEKKIEKKLEQRDTMGLRRLRFSFLGRLSVGFSYRA
jgi:hypothetical protein